jgi:hypothetical protein
VSQLINYDQRLRTDDKRGDAKHVRAISQGEALSHAQAVMKANRKMNWELVDEVEKPKILWARIAQVHEDTEVAQIAVRFDTRQVSQSQPQIHNLRLKPGLNHHEGQNSADTS